MQVLIESAWLNNSHCCKPATPQIGSFPLMVQAAAADVCCLRATSSYQMDRSRVRVFAGCRGGIPNILRITLDYTQIMLDCPSAKRIEAVEPSLPLQRQARQNRFYQDRIRRFGRAFEV